MQSIATGLTFSPPIPQTKVRQGCLLLQTNNLPEETAKQLIFDADRSFLEQASAEIGSPTETGLRGVMPQHYVFHHNLRTKAHDNSWGAIVSNSGQHLLHVLEANGMGHTDSTFKQKLSSVLGNDINAHARMATLGGVSGEAAIRNAQPLVNKGLAMTHNGSIAAALDPWVTREIHRWLPSEKLYNDDSDSRRINAYIRAQMNKYLGSDDPAKSDTKAQDQVIVHSLRTLFKHNPPIDIPLTTVGQGLPIDGTYRYEGSNFIFNHGDHTLVYRQVNPLYLWAKTTEDGQKITQTAIMTEPPHIPGMIWKEVANQHVLTLDKQKDGTIEMTMKHMDLVKKPRLPLERQLKVALYAVSDWVSDRLTQVGHGIAAISRQVSQWMRASSSAEPEK